MADSMPALKRDLVSDDLRPLLQETGLDGTVAIQSQPNVQETEWLLALAETYDNILGLLGWVGLCASDVRADLARVAAVHALCACAT
jgi:L-fuconolactonase